VLGFAGDLNAPGIRNRREQVSRMSRLIIRFPRPGRLDGTELMSQPVVLGGFGLLLGIMLLVRCPATLLHPEFWGENGPIWYADRLLRRLALALFPQNGYLLTISRLLALLAQGFPLQWGPALFTAAALIVQMAVATFSSPHE
jgi:hypothetical protein